MIGADRAIYQDLADLVTSTQTGDSTIEEFDCSVFDGKYVTGDVDENYLNSIDVARNDAIRQDNKKGESNETNNMQRQGLRA